MTLVPHFWKSVTTPIPMTPFPRCCGCTEDFFLLVSTQGMFTNMLIGSPDNYQGFWSNFISTNKAYLRVLVPHLRKSNTDGPKEMLARASSVYNWAVKNLGI